MFSGTKFAGPSRIPCISFIKQMTRRIDFKNLFSLFSRGRPTSTVFLRGKWSCNNPRFQMELSVSNGTVLATRVIYTRKKSCFLAWHAKNYNLKLVESCVLCKFLIRELKVFAQIAQIFFRVMQKLKPICARHNKIAKQWLNLAPATNLWCWCLPLHIAKKFITCRSVDHL